MTDPSWQPAAANAKLYFMHTINSAPNETTAASRLETEAEKQRRFVQEAEQIAEARADVAAGRLVSSANVKAWTNSIGSDHELPVPYSGR